MISDGGGKCREVCACFRLVVDRLDGTYEFLIKSRAFRLVLEKGRRENVYRN